MRQELTPTEQAHRLCSKCGESKPLTPEHFQADAQKRNGFRPDCKVCRHADYARKSPDSLKLAVRSLAKVGLKPCFTCGQHKSLSDFTVRSVNADGLSENCRACESERRRRKRDADKAKFDAPAKAYKSRNRDKVRERARLYAAKRRSQDPQFRLRGAIGRLVGCFLKRRGHSKSGQDFFAAVGYTVEQLVEHVERQFLPGMTWQNYGEWHLDHILPNASFDYSSMECAEFRACWSLPNLRPLWKAENLQKGSKRTTLL